LPDDPVVTSARVRKALAAALDEQRRLVDDDELLESLARLAGAVVRSLRTGGRVWLFGNGGSAADAQHIAAELVGRFRGDRPAFAAEALTVNTSILTSVANDYGFEHVFARQLEASAREGDVAIGISTSGSSENVLNGLRVARRLGLHAAALTGADGRERLGSLAECVVVPSSDTPRVQEAHIVLGHVLCELVEESLAADA
jgi:D-sedoheptulose 7-phosphate isomerase